MAELIYGKVFGSLFEGSMVGAGAEVFALMAYVISHMQPNKEREEFVKLNPDILGPIIGETSEVMQGAIDYLCAPDLKTSTPGHEGRRLVKREAYLYWVVNGKHYREVKNEEDRRIKAADRQARWRSEHSKSRSPRTRAQAAANYDNGLSAFVTAKNNGKSDEEAHAIAFKASGDQELLEGHEARGPITR